MGSIRVVRGGPLAVGAQSDGIIRQMDQIDEEVSLSLATIEANVMSSWHHHGHTSSVHVLEGPVAH